MKNLRMRICGDGSVAVSAPPYVILRGQEIESVVFTTQSGEIIIEGKSDDDHKIVANKFLDSVY